MTGAGTPTRRCSWQRDGNHQRTKLDWAKTRWATLEPEEKTVMLEWVLETQGYTVTQLDTAGASDDELDQRIDDYLTKHPASSTRQVQANVKGTNGRIKARLDAKFDVAKGPNRANLWLPRTSAGAADCDAPTHLGENPDEY